MLSYHRTGNDLHDPTLNPKNILDNKNWENSIPPTPTPTPKFSAIKFDICQHLARPSNPILLHETNVEIFRFSFLRLFYGCPSSLNIKKLESNVISDKIDMFKVISTIVNFIYSNFFHMIFISSFTMIRTHDFKPLREKKTTDQHSILWRWSYRRRKHEKYCSGMTRYTF